MLQSHRLPHELQTADYYYLLTHNKLDLQLKAAAEARALVLAKQVKEAEVAVAKAQADLQGSINVRIITCNCMHIETYCHDSYRDLVKSHESLVISFHSLFISRAIFFLSFPSWCVTHSHPLYCTVLYCAYVTIFTGQEAVPSARSS
jgi:hypothetical protein